MAIARALTRPKRVVVGDGHQPTRSQHHHQTRSVTPAAYASVDYLRDKLRPMVCGLFAPDESAPVLDLVVGSVVFLTRSEVHRILRETMWRCTAWNVASIWLDSIDARPLSESAPALLGLSEGTSCLVSLRYFHDLENDPFADYVVHEVAHLFHNNKRRYVGLPGRGRCEWMLDIDFRRRELFAHACEFFSRISARARGPKERLREIEAFAPRANSFAEEFEPAELLDVLREAARARNG